MNAPACGRRVDAAVGTGVRSAGARPSLAGGYVMGAAAQIEPSVQEFVGTKLRKMLIGGKWVDARRARPSRPQPRHRRLHLRTSPRATPRTSTAPCARRAQAFESGPWRAMTPRASAAGSSEHRRPDREARRRAGRSSRRSTTASRSATRAPPTSPLAADMFRYYAGWATKIEGDTIPSRSAGRDYLNYTRARAGRRRAARSSRGTSRS